MPVVVKPSSPRLTLEEAKAIWKRASAVCFDVDSTLIREEGLDKLAHFCGAGEEVARLTVQAMGGSMTFREALRARLEIVKPTLQQVQAFRDQNPADVLLTPGVEELVALLHSRGVVVYLVSGGFRKIIEPFAEHLRIPKENIFANRLTFGPDGKYTGFDETEPTSSSGGKPRVVAQLKKKHSVMVMIGDGATDMEASPPADAFIGFGGNVVREKVKAGAHWFTYDFQDLIDELRPVQNGLGTQNGIHVNEGVTNGVANGVTSNGVINGFSEVRTNGTSNGFSNSNGYAEEVRPKVKAAVNGLPVRAETQISNGFH